MTDNIKQPPPAPLPKRNTADQDLVAAWDERQRQSARIRLEATEDGPMVLQPDVPDMTLWQARLSKALGITDPQVIGNVLSQLGSCSPDGNVEQMLNDLKLEHETIVICHHGMRSFQVGNYLEGNGFTQIANLEGGVDAWAKTIDAEMAQY